MSTAPSLAVHVVAADLSAGRLNVLRALVACPGLSDKHVLVNLGPAGFNAAGLPQPVRLWVPFGVGRLGFWALRRASGKPAGAEAGSPPVLHVWSSTGLACVGSAAAAGWPVVVETESGFGLEPVARGCAQRCARGPVTFVCRSVLAQERLRRWGASAERCLLIREFVDLAELERAAPAQLREQLGLRPNDTVLVALPPVSRRSGTFIAAWAALLLEKIRPEVRLIVPSGGREQDRIRRLARFCRHEHVVRFADASASLADLAAAADLALFLPTGDVPLTGMAWAMAAGRPIIASQVPAVRELMAHGENAWLCQPGDPKDAARQMLRALESPEESRRRAEQARALSQELFDRRRMIEQYVRVYAEARH